MAIFIKLANGEVINSLAISSVRKHEHATVEELVRARVRARQDNGSAEQYLDSIPSIQVFRNGEPNPTLLKFDSVERRDEEFDRIEAILLQPQAIITFGSLMFDIKLIQSLSVEWQSFSDTTLNMWVKMPGIRRFRVVIDRANQAEWERGMNLLTQFNIQLPAVPEW